MRIRKAEPVLSCPSPLSLSPLILYFISLNAMDYLQFFLRAGSVVGSSGTGSLSGCGLACVGDRLTGDVALGFALAAGSAPAFHDLSRVGFFIDSTTGTLSGKGFSFVAAAPLTLASRLESDHCVFVAGPLALPAGAALGPVASVAFFLASAEPDENRKDDLGPFSEDDFASEISVAELE